MVSNSKLTMYQQTVRAFNRKTAKLNKWAIAHNGATTIVYKCRGNTTEFAMSVASPDETQFRRKVGEFYALRRFQEGETVKMLNSDFADLYEMFNMRE